MGKRVRGAELRAKKRARSAVDELQEKQAHELATASVTDKKDTELFVLDVTGETVHPSQQVEKKKRKKETGLSEKDKQAVAKLVEKHEGSVSKLKELAAQGRLTANNQRRVRTKGMRGQTGAKFDLWETNHDAVVALSKDVKAEKKIVAHTPGIGASLAGISAPHALVNTRRAKAPSQKAWRSTWLGADSRTIPIQWRTRLPLLRLMVLRSVVKTPLIILRLLLVMDFRRRLKL
jgi:hypothetical protein